ncbi:MAG TPA: ectonucleotide pyrophosphatase/phosphodiesterase, partial [Acidobacteriaceae bacterium]|nr:ectonucleotide pyrophosphatase/phosphodiesterase [Acidobacteriaceae bacterium]
MRRLLFALLLTVVSLPPAYASPHPKAPVIEVPNADNRTEQVAKHYVVLVSIDGFRYDYAKLYGATHLDAVAREGATAPDGMLPAYPSVTFPNHYTLVTGLYPEHHGIVAMSFYDPERRERYAFNDPKTVTDGSWYRGVPLWSLAEKQGMRAACFFWPGSEAEIAGARPSYYLKYDEKVPDEERVDQVVDWLKLPEAKRPHFVTLYFSEVDHAGHEYGPDAPETRAAVRHVDSVIGTLRAHLAKLHLPIDLVVVSDHGMATEQGGWIDLDQYVDFTGVETAGALMYPDSEQEAAKLYAKLRIVSNKFKVYRRDRMPAELDYTGEPRIGDPVIVATGPYSIRVHGPADSARDRPPNKGVHGYDPASVPEMRAIFYAEGPDIRKGARLKPFENVNVYPFLAE